MPDLPDQEEVRTALRAALAKALEVMASAAAQTREGATHEESRAEGDKDMRSTEQSYLARGQAMRAEELAEQIQRLDATALRAFGEGDAIAPGALVLVDVDGEVRTFFVVPWGGGTELDVGGRAVTVVTPASPVGRALLGKEVGDSFELAIRGATREWTIEEVA
jgi:transcription elongation GreA/GreB family factor